MRHALLGLLFGCLFAPVASSQEGGPPEGARFSVQRDGDVVKLSTSDRPAQAEHMLKAWSETTGRNFVVQPKSGVGGWIHVFGTVTVKVADADYAFESLLLTAGLLLTPVGPPEAKLFSVESQEHSRIARQSAPYAAPETLESLERSPAQLFTTTFVLKHAFSGEVRQAVQSGMSNRHLESVQDMSRTNALRVTAFGPALAALGRVVQAADRAATPAKSERFALKYAPASEARAALRELFTRVGPAAEGARPPTAEPRFIADDRTNAIVVVASEEDLAVVRAAIALLDVEATKPK